MGADEQLSLAMVISVNEPIPDNCEAADHIPFGMLDGTTGVLRQSKDAVVDLTPPQSTLRDTYKAVFEQHDLKICDDDSEVKFAAKYYPLAVKFKKKSGPVIISGADFDHHGQIVPAGGRFIHQRFIEYAIRNVTTNKRQLVTLCGDTHIFSHVFFKMRDESSAQFAAAENMAGWTHHIVRGPTEVASFFNNTNETARFANCGILKLVSGYGDSDDDLNDDEHTIINANANQIRDLVRAGGGLIVSTQAPFIFPGYEVFGFSNLGWIFLASLLPALSPNAGPDFSYAESMVPTGDGIAALPGIDLLDLSFGGPLTNGLYVWHTKMEGNVAPLKVWLNSSRGPIVIGGLLSL